MAKEAIKQKICRKIHLWSWEGKGKGISEATVLSSFLT